MDIYDEIRAERVRQDAKWGESEHGDRHGRDPSRPQIEDLERFIYDLLIRPSRRQNFIEIAALAVATVESLDRKAKADMKGEALE